MVFHINQKYKYYTITYYLWYGSMGRKRYTKPIEQITIRISIDAYEVLDGCREGRLGEPRYVTLDRVLTEYLHTRETIHKLKGEIEERDFIILDLKGSLERRRKEIEVYQQNQKTQIPKNN